MSICLLTMGGLGLLLALERPAPFRLRSRVATVGAAASGALTTLFGIYGVAPPFLTLGVVTLRHVYAWRTLRRHA